MKEKEKERAIEKYLGFKFKRMQTSRLAFSHSDGIA